MTQTEAREIANKKFKGLGQPFAIEWEGFPGFKFEVGYFNFPPMGKMKVVVMGKGNSWEDALKTIGTEFD